MLFEITSTCRNGDGYIYCRTNPSNLEVMTKAEHAKHHHVIANKEIVILCSGCDTPILIREKDYRFKIRYNKNGIYCSRSCAGRSLNNLWRSRKMSD